MKGCSHPLKGKHCLVPCAHCGHPCWQHDGGCQVTTTEYPRTQQGANLPGWGVRRECGCFRFVEPKRPWPEASSTAPPKSG